MQITSPAFKANSTEALADPFLQKAMGFVRTGFIDKRRAAIDAKLKSGLPRLSTSPSRAAVN